MNAFETKVLNFIRDNSMVDPDTTILVGFSGGADSTALLTALYELRHVLRIQLAAVHVNHGIRDDAEKDASFAASFCKARDIIFFEEKRDVPALSKEWNMTEEEAGRYVRYEIFGNIARECKATRIAVAHHQNDVAETLLMNLIRGTGLHGAGAIRPVRDNIIRPLLCVSRSEIEDYLSEKGQDYCNDYTNEENNHTRNIIRNILIPEMEKSINSATVSHLCRAADSFAGADEYIRASSEELYEKAVTEGDGRIEIDLEAFDGALQIIKAEIILKALEKVTPKRKDITTAHVDSIMKLAEGSEGSASVDLPYSLIAVRSYARMEIRKKAEKPVDKIPEDIAVPKNLNPGDEEDFFIPGLGVAKAAVLEYDDRKLFPTSSYTKWFDYDRIQEAIFRRRRSADYMLIEQGDGLCKKAIGKLMTDVKVPAPIRDEIYLLADGDEVIWIPGYRMSGAYKICDDTKNILEIKIDDGGNSNG